MSILNKIALISDNIQELDSNTIVYMLNKRIGIVYKDILIEAKYDAIYRIGKSIALIDKVKGNLSLIEENGTVHSLTLKQMKRQIQKLLGLKGINSRDIIIRNFVLKYAVALEINLHLDYYIQVKFKGLKIEELIKKSSLEEYYVAYRILSGNRQMSMSIQIDIKRKNKHCKDYTEASGIYDIQNNKWIVNILELSQVDEDLDRRIVNYYYYITYFIKEDNTLTDKVLITNTLHIVNTQDRFGRTYRLYEIKNNTEINIFIYSNELYTIKKSITLYAHTI